MGIRAGFLREADHIELTQAGDLLADGGCVINPAGRLDVGGDLGDLVIVEHVYRGELGKWYSILYSPKPLY